MPPAILSIVYAVGDVHGCASDLHRLLEQIEADARARGVPRPTVVFLGDYVDRGLHSRQVLDVLSSRELRQRFDPVLLMGNHDEYMLRACRNQLEGDRLFQWLAAWGGVETVESYGVETGRRSMPDFMTDFRAAVPREHLRLLEGLKLNHRIGRSFFCHAGVDPSVPLDSQTPETLLYGTSTFLGYEGDFGAKIVHGHFAVAAVEILPNRINVNSSAGYPGGRLSGVVILGEDAKVI
jgi:serine/threonine protein phosphatase 1